MPEITKRQITAPKSCRECEHWLDLKQKLQISELLMKAINGMEERLKTLDFKPTLGDYLKLLQLEQEMEEAGPTEIKVTWVDPESLSTTEK